MRPYIQAGSQHTTLEHWKEILADNEHSSFAAFAYVTDSGVAQLETHLGPDLGVPRNCRWLFGIDYGRSHPTALRRVANIGTSMVRIHDGAYITAESKTLSPRASFHLKTALTVHDSGRPCRQIVGSGNLSASGLTAGIEAGCAIDYAHVAEEDADALMAVLEKMWDESTPLDEIIDDYETQFQSVIQPGALALDPNHLPGNSELFWIDIGYVTKNRGPDRPGNQFDLPRGAHVLLGVEEVKNPELNSVLADLSIRTPTGSVVERRLRYGNNAMEKLTLPIPEENGFECYDGKILTFRIENDEVRLDAFEHDDFFRIHGKRISSCSEMQSGRRYGTASLP